jgi:hypothetical protein
MTMLALDPPSASDPSHDHEIAVLDSSGDSKITWSLNDEIAIENARRSFDYFREQGYTAFRVDGDEGGLGGLMNEFDPTAEQVVFVPPMVAG